MVSNVFKDKGDKGFLALNSCAWNATLSTLYDVCQGQIDVLEEVLGAKVPWDGQGT